MTPAETEFAVALTEMIVTKGVPAAIEIIRNWKYDGEEPTITEIRALRDIRSPDDIFSGCE